MSAQSTADLIHQLANLRLLVGLLGERSHFNWWPTEFFAPSSRPFLEPALPKSWRLAQFHGVVEAARHLHDEHLSVGNYHLFRLTEELEQDLHNRLVREAEAASTIAEVRDTEQALERLHQIADSQKVEGVGPLAIAKMADILKATTVQRIAAAYLKSFRTNQRALPYLVR